MTQVLCFSLCLRVKTQRSQFRLIKREVELVALYRGNNLYLQPFKNLKFQDCPHTMESSRARAEDRFNIPEEVRKEMKRLAITPKTPEAFFWGTVEVPRTPATNFGFLLRKKKGEGVRRDPQIFCGSAGRRGANRCYRHQVRRDGVGVRAHPRDRLAAL